MQRYQLYNREVLLKRAIEHVSIEHIKEYREAGAQEFMLVFPDLDKEQIKIFADSVISCMGCANFNTRCHQVSAKDG